MHSRYGKEVETIRHYSILSYCSFRCTTLKSGREGRSGRHRATHTQARLGRREKSRYDDAQHRITWRVRYVALFRATCHLLKLRYVALFRATCHLLKLRYVALFRATCHLLKLRYVALFRATCHLLKLRAEKFGTLLDFIFRRTVESRDPIVSSVEPRSIPNVVYVFYCTRKARTNVFYCTRNARTDVVYCTRKARIESCEKKKRTRRSCST